MKTMRFLLLTLLIMCAAAGVGGVYAADAPPATDSGLGTVSLITVTPADNTDNATADNATVEHVLVNGIPAAIPVEKTAMATINIKEDPKYPMFIKVNPNLALSAAGVEFEKIQTAEAGGLRYLFLFMLRDGCDECEAAGYARIAFNFAKDGKFTGAALIKLMRTRQPLQ